MAEIDYEGEGLLEGVEESEREARLDLLRFLSGEGFEIDDLRRAAHEGRLVLLPIERVLAGEGSRYTSAEVAEETGMDRTLLDRAWRALGIVVPEEDDAVFTQADLEGARIARQILDAGLEPDRFFEMSRVMSRALAPVAATIFQTFGDALIEPGDSELDLGRRYAEAMRELGPLLGPTLEHMLGVRLREQIRQAAVGSAERLEGGLPGAQRIAICFADVVGFTKLGEQIEVGELDRLVARLEDMAEDVATGPVRLIKTIGDAVMLVSPDPAPLLGAAVDLVESAGGDEDDFPPLSAGVAFGEALNRAGDWYGRPVNLASRIAEVARPGSVLCDSAIENGAGQDFDFSFAGKRRIKGVRGEVALHRARRAAQG